jgi:hypothetical protein
MFYMPFPRRLIPPASMLITLRPTLKNNWHRGGHIVDP